MLSLVRVVPAFSPSVSPNILFVLADDFNADWKSDRLSYMPHLKKHFAEGGVEFVNHVAAIPVCGPSRSSFLVRHSQPLPSLLHGQLPGQMPLRLAMGV